MRYHLYQPSLSGVLDSNLRSVLVHWDGGFLAGLSPMVSKTAMALLAPLVSWACD